MIHADDLHALFEKFNDDYLKFDRVEAKLHPRPDLCAFLLLDRLCPAPGRDLVNGAEHDKIYLGVDCEKLCKVATEADILTLIRCGISHDEEMESLYSFA